MAASSPVDATRIITNNIRISNLPSKYCSVGKLAECFCNKKKSGISSFKEIKMEDQNTAILCLENDEAVKKVLEWHHKHKSLGENVEMIRIVQHVAPLPKNKSFSIRVVQRHLACLQRYQQDLESQLNDLHATQCIDKEKKEVQVIPCQGNEGIEDWQARCQDVVDRFIKRLKDEKFVVPLEKKALMRPVIDDVIQNEPLVYIDYMEDKSTVYITGKPTEVNKVKKKLEDTCEGLANEKLSIPLDKKDLLHPVIDETIQNEQSLHFKYMEDKSIVFITGERSEVIRVKKHLEDICESLIDESFNVPLDKKDLMDPFIETIQNKRLLRIEYVKDMSIVFITGKQSKVIRVKKKLEDTCNSIVVKGKFPITSEKFYFLLNAVLLDNLLIEHPNVKASIDKDSRCIIMTGFINYCEQFKIDLSEINKTLQCVLVLLQNPFDQFIITQTGRKLLDYYAGKFILQSITYYVDQTSKLFILGPRKSQAAIDALACKIKNNLHYMSIPFTVTFQKSLLDSAWVDFSNNLKESQLVQIRYAKNKIEVIGDSQMCELTRKAIQNFIAYQDVMVKRFALHSGQWRLIKLHLTKEWCKLECKYQKDNRVQLTLHDENPSITIEADVQVFKVVEEEIKTFLSMIVSSQPIMEKRHSIIDYFYSEAGKSAVRQIETDELSCVHISQLEDDNAALVSNDGVVIHASPGLKCDKVCTGFTNNLTITLYHGDITTLPVDVMVNATNLQLQHTKGVAEAISQAGGPCIQADSDAHLKSVGKMKEDEVIIMQEVGNLPCKCLIHVVSPTWIDGTHEELRLLNMVCTRALQKASHFQSISFPAIGCGSYEFPPIRCAKIMVEAVIKYSQSSTSSSISEVSFVVLDQDEVHCFGKIMRQLLLNVTCTPSLLKALTVPPTLTPETSQHTDDKAFTTEEGDDGFVIVRNKKDQSTHDNSTGTCDDHFLISKRNTASDFVPVQGNQEDYIELCSGELLKYPADIYVNTVGTDLQLGNGAVSRSFLQAGGQALQDECKLHVRQHGNVPVGHIVVTKPGAIVCERIIHTVGTRYDGKNSEGVMRDIIQKCLMECDKLKASVIAFPALGTGNLKYSAHVVADIMINTITDYMKANKSTTHIKTVKLVIYAKDDYQEFCKVYTSVKQLTDKTNDQSLSKATSNSQEADSISSQALSDDNKESQDIMNSQNFGSNSVDSYLVDTLVVEFVQGDITDDDSDAIVNPTNESMCLFSGGQVSSAMLNKGGSELQIICDNITSQGYRLKNGMVCPTDSTGSLVCKKIFHINVHSDSLLEVIFACLHQAEVSQLTSIAFPAIGTGGLGYDVEVAAQFMCQPVIEFAQSLPKYVKSVRFVIFQKDMVYYFKQAFHQLRIADLSGGMLKPSKSQSLPLFLQKSSAIEPSLDIKPSLALSQTELAENIPVITKKPAESIAVIIKKPIMHLQVFADCVNKVQRTENRLQQLIEKQLHTARVDDKYIVKLSTDFLAEIKQEADFRNVFHDIKQGRQQHYIQLKGDRIYVDELMLKINSALTKISDDEEKQQKFHDTVAKVRWQWQKQPGVFEDYDDSVIYAVEQAYQSDPNSSFIVEHTNGSSETFCFQKRTAQHGNDIFVIRRFEKTEASPDIDLPKQWDPMPPNTDYIMVTLDMKSDEYSSVKKDFRNTLSRSYKIITIKRVQNPGLYKQYMVKKKVMDQRNPKTVQNERRLFHGCSEDVTKDISHHGFNRSFAGKHGTVYGQGAYFARDASYSDQYSSPDYFNCKHMFLVKVLTGECARGQSHYVQPPQRNPGNSKTDLYDACVDNIINPRIFVIFRDWQAYPEYLITYT